MQSHLLLCLSSLRVAEFLDIVPVIVKSDCGFILKFTLLDSGSD